MFAAADQGSRARWLAVAGVFAIYVSFGFTIGVMAPLVDEISADLQVSRSTMGSILGAWALIYVLTAVPAGAVVDRLGLRWSLVLGGVSIAVSGLLRGSATDATTLFAAVAVFGIGGPLVSIAMPKLIAALFDDEARRLPTGLGVAAPALGSAMGLALTNPVLLPLADGDWRTVVRYTASFAALATIFWMMSSGAVRAEQRGATRTDLATLRRVSRLTAVRAILGICLFSFFYSHAVTAWLPEILTDAGRSDNGAGYLAALSTTSGIAGALMIARLVPEQRRCFALMCIFGLLAMCMVALSFAPLWLHLPTLGLLGFVRAGIIPLLFLEIMGDPNVSVSDIGAATGLFFMVGEIGGFSGPYAIGYVADVTDGFTAATLLLAGIALVAAWFAGSLNRLRREHVIPMV